MEDNSQVRVKFWRIPGDRLTPEKPGFYWRAIDTMSGSVVKTEGPFTNISGAIFHFGVFARKHFSDPQ